MLPFLQIYHRSPSNLLVLSLSNVSVYRHLIYLVFQLSSVNTSVLHCYILLVFVKPFALLVAELGMLLSCIHPSFSSFLTVQLFVYSFLTFLILSFMLLLALLYSLHSSVALLLGLYFGLIYISLFPFP